VDEKLARLTDDELSDHEILKNNGVEIVERQNPRQAEKEVPDNNNDDDDEEEEEDDDLPTGM
jgi:cobalamin biosynthesis protein CobT